MNLCDSCKKWEGCKNVAKHAKKAPDLVEACPDNDPITRADLAAREAEWNGSGLTPQNMWDEIQAIRKLVGDDGAHGSPREVVTNKVIRKGQCAIGIYEMQMLRDFAARRMSQREHDRLEKIRDDHEDELRATEGAKQ